MVVDVFGKVSRPNQVRMTVQRRLECSALDCEIDILAMNADSLGRLIDRYRFGVHSFSLVFLVKTPVSVATGYGDKTQPFLTNPPGSPY